MAAPIIEFRQLCKSYQEADQELALSFRYREGAVEFDGVFGDSSVNGRGYVELTGYGTTSAPRVR